MLKAMAFIFFVTAGAIGGICISERMKLFRDTCRDIRGILEQIAVLIRFREMNVYEISAELKRNNLYAGLGFLQKLPDTYTTGEDFHYIWNTAVRDESCIGKEEQQCLIEFGAVLGTSDINGQLTAIKTAIEKIRIIELHRNEEYANKNKMYRSVGVLFGAMTGIMLM